jgi:hypothetical protein
MLNLSDKELDRLSREAAQEYDPGDLSEMRGWERLEVHLDRDLGKVGPNPIRGIRRFPFFYAPAILLILGVSYYFVRSNRTKKAEPSGSPPPTVLQAPTEPGKTTDPSTKNSVHSDNSTSTPDKKPVTVPYPDGSGQPASASPLTPTTGHGAVARQDRPSSASPFIPAPAAGNGSSVDAGKNSVAASGKTSSATSGKSSSADVGENGALSGGTHRRPSAQNGTTNGIVGAGGHTRKGSGGPLKKGDGTLSGEGGILSGEGGILQEKGEELKGNGGGLSARVGADVARPRELAFSSVRHARPMKQLPTISDSGLRAYSAKTNPMEPIKRKGVLRVNRSLQLGLSLAPDFSSVNSLAGDKPGSSIGLTVDYQFANRWYLSTGLLVSRKNYAARPQDYHVPYDYYQRNNMHNVDFVKGTFNMLEIPLNLRYDFSVTGNTVFFASSGLSSYLFTNEHCDYYYPFFGRETSKGFSYPGHNNYLFSAVNLSLGVEAGISNSFSLLVAPYMKIPTRNLGFGQVQMNSVGIDFSLKYTPVLSRKRR